MIAAVCHAAGRLLLASASQDKNIRIWAIVPEAQAELLPAAPATYDPEQPMLPAAISRYQLQRCKSEKPLLQYAMTPPIPPGVAAKQTCMACTLHINVPPVLIIRYAPKPRIQAGRSRLTAMLESVLIGHEDWVHSVAWQPLAAAASGRPQQRPCLLSASMDRTMMLWRPDAGTGSLVSAHHQQRIVLRHTCPNWDPLEPAPVVCTVGSPSEQDCGYNRPVDERGERW